MTGLITANGQQRAPVAQALPYLGGREPQRRVGDEVGDDTLALVLLAEALEPRRAEVHQVVRGAAEEAPQGERQLDVVDHGSAPEQGCSLEGDGHAPDDRVLVVLTGGELEPVIEPPGELE